MHKRGRDDFFETKRLFLRNVKEKDLNTIFEYRNNEKCNKYQRGQSKDYEKIKHLIGNHKKHMVLKELMQ